MTDADIKRELLKINAEMDTLQLKLDTLVAGRKIRVLSNYNGQPYGRSRKSLHGQVLTVERGSFHGHWGISFATEEERLYINEKEVEWL